MGLSRNAVNARIQTQNARSDLERAFICSLRGTGNCAPSQSVLARLDQPEASMYPEYTSDVILRSMSAFP